jgi:hypothetical protein
MYIHIFIYIYSGDPEAGLRKNSFDDQRPISHNNSPNNPNNYNGVLGVIDEGNEQVTYNPVIASLETTDHHKPPTSI